MKNLPIIIIVLIAALFIMSFLSGCATEYYPPRDGEKQGAVKREGFVSWSGGVGKSFLNPSFNVVGK